ncbi:MAG: GNAT family N-acetyltransferase [Clostridiales bacterium]|nr:GNAT family N-acetyltransferase [Clostridiales bacterium]
MELRLVRSGAEPPEGCAEIFRNSAIHDRYFRDPGRLENSLRRAAAAGELYLALDGAGRALGAMRVVMGGFCGLYPYLSLIGVRDGCRGEGVGAFLMEELERMARTAGARRVMLMVSDFNEGGQRFYQRLGYWKLGELPDAVKEGITELVMVKDLI